VSDESIAAMTDVIPLPVSSLATCWRSLCLPGRRNAFRCSLQTTPITPSVEELPYRLHSWSFSNDLYTAHA